MGEQDILHEAGSFWVCRENYGKTEGFAVYRNGLNYATRVAQIGYSGAEGLARAKNEADRRAKEENAGAGTIKTEPRCKGKIYETEA